MATAKKLPSGSWRVRVYVGDDSNGKHIYKSFTAGTKKEAEFLAAEYNLKRKEKPKDLTVGDAIDGYIDNKDGVLSPSTIRSYKSVRNNQLQELMSVPLNKLTNVMVQASINRAARVLSPKSVRNAHGLLTAAVTMYMPDFIFRTTLPAKEHKIKNLPKPKEIIDAVRESDIELPVMLALWLSLRMSEVRGIRYKDISNGILTIRNVKLESNIEKESTKTYNSTRQLALPERIATIIGTGDPDEYVVKFASSTIYRHFVQLIEEKTGKHMTFHDLRHMNASIMLALGIPDKYAMERGGWSTSSTLKNVYQHTFTDERRITDKKIDDYMEKLFDSE
ncbi:MAG: site-specific integrase [Ruminococcus sp.]|nr:site-specific integrase [Ruminococcus sp.]